MSVLRHLKFTFFVMANRGSTSVVVNGLEVQKHFLPQTSFTQSKHFYCYCRLCIILTFTLTLRWMHREQLELQYLAKGFFGMQIRGARDPFGRWPALPPKPQPEKMSSSFWVLRFICISQLVAGSCWDIIAKVWIVEIYRSVSDPLATTSC